MYNNHRINITEGTIINQRWRVVESIGHGTFAHVYCGKDLQTNEFVAIKVETCEGEGTLKNESNVLGAMQDSQCVCRKIYYYEYANTRILIMQLVGESISLLRKKSDQIPKAQIYSYAKQMLEALQQLHSRGFIHRDVKPANYLRGVNNNKERIYIIDFGLCKQHILPNGKIREARTDAPFRGTTLYSSPLTHQGIEQSRRDDIWGWLFTVWDLFGELPWKQVYRNKDIQSVENGKSRGDATKQMVINIKWKYYEHPEQFDDIPEREFILSVMRYLKTLQYESAPDYNYLYGLIDQYNCYLPCIRFNRPVNIQIGTPDHFYDWFQRSIYMLENHEAATQADVLDMINEFTFLQWVEAIRDKDIQTSSAALINVFKLYQLSNVKVAVITDPLDMYQNRTYVVDLSIYNQRV